MQKLNELEAIYTMMIADAIKSKTKLMKAQEDLAISKFESERFMKDMKQNQ